MDDAQYQAYIDRLTKIFPTEVKSIGEDGDTLIQGVVVDGNVVHDLILYPHTLDQQRTVNPSQIMWWGALLARAKRVWQIESRRLTIWKAAFRLKHEGTESEETGKKLTKAQVEDLYRQEAEYLTLNIAVERAEEAYNTVEMAVEAFKAKGWFLNRDSRRGADQAL